MANIAMPNSRALFGNMDAAALLWGQPSGGSPEASTAAAGNPTTASRPRKRRRHSAAVADATAEAKLFEIISIISALPEL